MRHRLVVFMLQKFCYYSGSKSEDFLGIISDKADSLPGIRSEEATVWTILRVEKQKTEKVHYQEFFRTLM